MTLVVAREVLAEQRYELRPFWPWPDDRHLAANHIEELWQFVDARTAQERSDARRAAIPRGRPDRTALRFGIDWHRAELEQVEFDAVASDAPLTVQDGRARFDIDRDGSAEHDRP